MNIDDLTSRYGVARRPERAPVHDQPDGVSDEVVAAVGKLSAALETAEVARGHLYDFHRYSGTVDREVQEAVEALRDAGRPDIADAVEQVMVGRDVIEGMWSFQIVEQYDAQYWEPLRNTAEAARRAAGLSEPHVYESNLKYQEQAGARSGSQ